MIKRILFSVVLLPVFTYLAVATTAFNQEPAGQVHHDVESLIEDTIHVGFITKREVTAMLEERDISPIGRNIDRIHAKPLEQALSEHPLIGEVECYKTPSGKLYIEVAQRTPILWIMSANGENYYLDNKGTMMPPDAKCVAHRAIITRNVGKSLAMRDLYRFGVSLQKDSFWNTQIEQVHVLPGGNIELVSRIGDHIIYLGKLDGFERELRRVKTFYEKGLNKVGWNKYSRISVESGNQVIYTKRQ